MDTLKIIIFYGGDAATEPRDALLNWLRKPQTATILGKPIDARKVSDEIPNSGYTVDQRVEQAIAWADKAIMLFTPDTRSDYGAPNLIEEYGRWRSKKGGITMATIRHKDIKVHSNAAGLIYIGYNNDVVAETSEQLLLFLQAGGSLPKVKPLPATQQTPITKVLAKLAANLVERKDLYDLSRNEIYADFDFIGIREKRTVIDLVAWVQADGLTESRVVELRDRFFEITCTMPTEFGFKPRGRNPNGLLAFVFADGYPLHFAKFIQKQSKISRVLNKSGVIVSWVIDFKTGQIHTHNNPVSVLPPMVIVARYVFPELTYLQGFVESNRLG